MKKLIVISALVLFSVSTNAFAEKSPLEKQCTDWGVKDSTIKPWELSDYIKACVAAKSKESPERRNVKFQWKNN